MTSWGSEHVDEEYGPGWGTPEYIVEPLEDAMGGFDLDPAAGAEPRPYAEDRILPGPDDSPTEGGGLDEKWYGDVWLNPPFGRWENPAWAEKVQQELSNVDSMTCLVPSSTAANWFQDTYESFDLLAFPGFRIEYLSGDSFAPAGFDSVIAVYGDYPEEYPDALESIGRPDRDDDKVLVSEVRR